MRGLPSRARAGQGSRPARRRHVPRPRLPLVKIAQYVRTAAAPADAVDSNRWQATRWSQRPHGPGCTGGPQPVRADGAHFAGTGKSARRAASAVNADWLRRGWVRGE